MKRDAKKLRLNRETLLALNDPNLRAVAGGISTACDTDPTLCATNCAACEGWTDTCRRCSGTCP